MKKSTKSVLVLGVMCFSLLSIINLSYNSSASTKTLKTSYVRINWIEIENNLADHEYDLKFSLQWERIYGAYGGDFSADNQYSSTLGWENWKIVVNNFEGYRPAGTRIYNGYYYLPTSYGIDISASGYEYKMLVTLDNEDFLGGEQKVSFEFGSGQAYNVDYSKTLEFSQYGGAIEFNYRIVNT
ncbi:hypothetical protein DSAG12_02256 [Promethearchaeum syntrophicum]|uniref:Uncharacterized protein n=1 Tax=Promethearchaeum syntrophicum TaxID=2594042 RepID=A0A5B9DCJ9_9ARCH|nr:hypothetical protein [Candidatus Prometheoarchaeum syntrophicum]QEE16426.1 hypothetical protein DSAG12_02256 [Candidatus Prometheoarchaeum syntrophicum]